VFLALRFIPESKAPVARKVDVPGQVLVITLLSSLTFGIIEAPNRGWTSAPILGAFALATASLAGFLVWERRAPEPLVDLRFFRSVPFASATVIAVLAFSGLGGFLFLNTIYLQDVRGLSALHAGIDTLPMAAMVMLLPPVSGRILSRRGGRIPLVIAGLALATACFMLVGLSASTPFSWLFCAYAVFGIGFGFVNAPITNAAVAGMPRAQAGVAAAIASTSRQVGATLGVAVVGSLVASSLHPGSRAAFALASRAGWWVLAGCGTAILVIGLVATSGWANVSARRTAALINPEYLE
jgi:MFS family permease